MDIRPGYVDHKGCVPHTQALWSLNIFGGLGTVISTVCTRFLDRRPWRWIRFLWKYLIRQEGLPQLWRCLLCPGPFFHAESITKIKNSGTEQTLCAAVCFIHCIKPYMLSALLPCLSERQTTYPAGAIMIRIKMLISSFTSDGAKPCSIVMRLFAKCTRMGNSRFLFFS